MGKERFGVGRNPWGSSQASTGMPLPSLGASFRLVQCPFRPLAPPFHVDTSHRDCRQAAPLFADTLLQRFPHTRVGYLLPLIFQESTYSPFQDKHLDYWTQIATIKSEARALATLIGLKIPPRLEVSISSLSNIG